MINSKKILVVEDDFINMRLAEHVLETEGYTVLRATTAREALEQIESTLPDLVLMDVQLPDIDGMTVVKILKGNARTGGIIILALTACAMIGDRERILQAGCDGYISKPFVVQDFIDTVRRFLDAGTSIKSNDQGACY